jgi:hypothetical protein
VEAAAGVAVEDPVGVAADVVVRAGEGAVDLRDDECGIGILCTVHVSCSRVKCSPFKKLLFSSFRRRRCHAFLCGAQ